MTSVGVPKMKRYLILKNGFVKILNRMIELKKFREQ
ncbi:hypothetical protein ACVW0P_002537 [Mucilaginibacter sp. UYNi724]